MCVCVVGGEWGGRWGEGVDGSFLLENGAVLTHVHVSHI